MNSPFCNFLPDGHVKKDFCILIHPVRILSNLFNFSGLAREVEGDTQRSFDLHA